MAIRITPLLLLIAAAILVTGTAFAADPDDDDQKASQQAIDGTQVRVHTVPADHQSRQIAEQLRAMLSGKADFVPQAFEQERLANGLVRMRVGVEGLNLAILTTSPGQDRVAACVQKPTVESTPEKSEGPVLFSLPANEGWVER